MTSEDPTGNNSSGNHVVLSDDDGSSNLFMRPESRNEGGQPLPERAITPITDREMEHCPIENVMDNTLDQYIEDLREANKQADIRKMQMEQETSQAHVERLTKPVAEPVTNELQAPEKTETPKCLPKPQQQNAMQHSKLQSAAAMRTSILPKLGQ